jgi:hypothetical protein
MNLRDRLRTSLGDELLADLMRDGTQKKLQWLASVVNDLDRAYTPGEVRQWFDITQLPLDGMTPRQCLTKDTWEPESENAIRVQILATVLSGCYRFGERKETTSEIRTRRPAALAKSKRSGASRPAQDVVASLQAPDKGRDELLAPAYEPDDVPLTPRQVASVRKAAGVSMPKGKVLTKQSLFGRTPKR